MIFQAAAQTPFEFVSTHVHFIGWGAVLIGVYKGTRFLTKLMAKFNLVQVEFQEMHKAVTAETTVDLKRLVTLA